MIRIYFLLFSLLLSCHNGDPAKIPSPEIHEEEVTSQSATIIILGVSQDAGAPQISCKKACCVDRFGNPANKEKVVSLGLFDHVENLHFLFEATPDIVEQMHHLLGKDKSVPDGIFLTHAHIGHYTGLMYIGKEAINAKEVPVYAMPKMQDFLSTNGPWSQLVADKNIKLEGLEDHGRISLSDQLQVIPFSVPHRDEYSETVGYKIIGPNKSALFIPDIDKWHLWDKDISKELEEVDYAFIDATFYDAAEINNRDISQIPHPFVIESMARFDTLPKSERNKIVLIHLNHTNPLLRKDSEQYEMVISKGYHVAHEGEVYNL